MVSVKNGEHYTQMSCLRLTNVNHSENCFVWKRTENDTVIAKTLHFHHMKKRTLAVQYRFIFLTSLIRKKILLFQNLLLFVWYYDSNHIYRLNLLIRIHVFFFYI